VVQLIVRLATSATHLSDALNSSTHEVMLMNIAQANAVRVTDGLIRTLHQMNETVMSALVDINSTATRVNQTIGANLYSFSSNILSLASAVVLSCESDHICLPRPIHTDRATDPQTVKQFSLLHLVASTVVRLLWSTLQNIPSLVVMVSHLISVVCVLR
jgi:hypothetical protein